MDCGAVKKQSLPGLGACSAVGIDTGTVGRWLGAGCLGVGLVFCRPTVVFFFFSQAGKWCD